MGSNVENFIEKKEWKLSHLSIEETFMELGVNGTKKSFGVVGISSNNIRE